MLEVRKRKNCSGREWMWSDVEASIAYYREHEILKITESHEYESVPPTKEGGYNIRQFTGRHTMTIEFWDPKYPMPEGAFLV